MATSRDFSHPRAAARVQGKTEEEIRFGGAAVAPAFDAAGKRAGKPGRDHRVCVVFDDGLFRRVKKYLASDDAGYRTLSEMARELIGNEVSRKGF